MSARSMKLGLLATVLRIAVFLSDPDPAAAAGGGIKMDLRILGGCFLRSSGDAAMTLIADTTEMAFEGRPTLSAIPIRLGLCYSLPLVGRLSLTAYAGVARSRFIDNSLTNP